MLRASRPGCPARGRASDDWLKGGGESELRRPPTIGETGVAAAKVLRRARLETPELDARVLLCHAAGLSHETYVAKADAPLAPEAASRFLAFIERRLKGEPVSRILGGREFFGRRFGIDADTLDPRPDTETLIEAALEKVERTRGRAAPLRILDLGTGSGAILVTLLAELPGATGAGTDISAAALRVAETNAEAHGVADRARFMVADWLEGVEGPFDLVVSNPPYIASAAIPATFSRGAVLRSGAGARWRSRWTRGLSKHSRPSARGARARRRRGRRDRRRSGRGRAGPVPPGWNRGRPRRPAARPGRTSACRPGHQTLSDYR